MRPNQSSPESPVNGLLGLIGRTPLLTLDFPDNALRIYAKAEFLNPSGSIKDRFAAAIFNKLRQDDLITPASILMEVSSGNTGISLAMLGAAHNIHVHILMSDTSRPEHMSLIQHLGAEISLFPAGHGYLTGIELSHQLAARDPSIFLCRQFESPLNLLDHATNTAPEILSAIPDGRVDAFVSGFGTGGTLAGVGTALRERNPTIHLASVLHDYSWPSLSELPCSQVIDGFSGGFAPPLLAKVRLDSQHHVSVDESLAMARRLAREFGLPVGPSSGANMVAALRLARMLGPKAHIVTILCDHASRYYTSPLFASGMN